jgi:hypothetical protein
VQQNNDETGKPFDKHCITVISFRNKDFFIQGGIEVLGRTIVLRVSSGCLNTWSCSFHLVATRKTRVAGWCKEELLFSII